LLKARRGSSGVPLVEHGAAPREAPGEDSRVLCGSFRLGHTLADPLAALLPKLIPVRTRGGAVPRGIASTLEQLDQEVENGASNSEAVVGRLTEVLCVDALERFLNSSPRAARDWLATTTDHQVGQALALIHDNPAVCDVAVLARRVGLSRTRFFDRFSVLVGEPPARYIARQRSRAAAQLLEQADLSLAEISERVGYGSPDAFARAFTRHMGATPAAWRRRLARRMLPPLG
jgi:AraC-like DNA-binding protein